jgi:hypothetical protein
VNNLVENILTSALHKLEADGRPLPHNRWQNMLSVTLRNVVPPLHQSVWMEWEYGNWIGSFAGYDAGGRQLGEANVIPPWLATPLKDNWQPFKGPGVRQGHPYNVDAMHEMLEFWNDLLTDAATLRDLHCRRNQRQGRLAPKDLYIITTVAISVPGFLLRRGDAPTKNGEIPRRAAAAFKVIGGMYAAANRMLSQAHPLLGQTELDIDDFLQYLEDERLLLSPESRACAAPVKMIRQIVGAAIDPSPDKLAQPGLPYLGMDLERAFAYGELCARIDLVVLLYWRSLRHYLKPLLRDAKTTQEVCEMLSQEHELGIADHAPLSAYARVAKDVLAMFAETAPEQEFIAELPFAEAEGQTYDIESIGRGCYRLETAMRTYFRRQQAALDQLLQRQSPILPEDAWSPAPGSSFLKALYKADKRLEVCA